jgi:hypothetical protein
MVPNYMLVTTADTVGLILNVNFVSPIYLVLLLLNINFILISYVVVILVSIWHSDKKKKDFKDKIHRLLLFGIKKHHFRHYTKLRLKL